MEKKMKIIIFLTFFQFYLALVVINRSPECPGKDGTGQNGTGCNRATIIRGETSIGLPAVCSERVDPGPCGRDLIRVYYHWETNRCKHFSYSGCGGNANRFVSIKNCYHICNPGLRFRIVNTKSPETDPETTTSCADKPKTKVKLNVTSVQQIEVEMK